MSYSFFIDWEQGASHAQVLAGVSKGQSSMWFISGWMSSTQYKPKKERVTMKLITVTLVAITGFGLCAAPRAFAENDSFVGKWKFNPDKRPHL